MDRDIVLETERLRLEPLRTSHASEMIESTAAVSIVHSTDPRRIQPRLTVRNLESVPGRGRGLAELIPGPWRRLARRGDDPPTSALPTRSPRRAWRQGFATEACRRIVDLHHYGRRECCRGRYAHAASIRLLERLGQRAPRECAPTTKGLRMMSHHRLPAD